MPDQSVITPITSCAILASDFSDNVNDPERHYWNSGKMRHAIAALQAARVVLTTDRMTGHTILGARLIGLTETVASGSCVVYAHDDTDHFPRPSAARLGNLGEAITPLETPKFIQDAKWIALETWRQEKAAAIRRARREHPECDYGRWSAVPGKSGVSWKYEPYVSPGKNLAFRNPEDDTTRGKPHFAYGSFSLEELAEETDHHDEHYKLAVI